VAAATLAVLLLAVNPDPTPDGVLTSSASLAEHQLPDARCAKVPCWSLPGGVSYPLIAVNTASLPPATIDGALHYAVTQGITNVDFHLGSEREGVALTVRSLGRAALFLTTKINPPPPNLTDASAAAELVRQSVATELNMSALGSDYVDLLLLKDSPSCDVMRAQWAVVEELLAQGKTRAVGVYNFCEFSLRCILATATVKPALNFLMRHVGMGPDPTGIIAFSAAHGIRTTAYGMLGEPTALVELLKDPTLLAIAAAHGKSPAAVALRWNLQAGFATSNRPTANYNNVASQASCTDNCSVALGEMAAEFSWALSAAEMLSLDGVRFTEPPQAPTYYASSGCLGHSGTFANVSKPNASACVRNASTPATGPQISDWC